MKNTLIKKDLIKGKPIRNRRGRIIGYEKVEKPVDKKINTEINEEEEEFELEVKELKDSKVPMKTTVNPDGSITSEGSGQLIGGELFTPGQPMTEEQKLNIEMGLKMGNTYSEEVMESYNMEAVKSEKSINPVIESDNKNLDLSSDNIDGDITQAIAKTNERIDNLIGAENKEQNNGNLVSANKPNVTEATLKLAAAPLPFVKVIKNNQLSTSPKSYNGLPPEIAAMIS